MDPLEGKMARTSSPASISTKLQRIAELARQAPEMVFTTLAHHIDLEFLKEAHRRTRKDGATGVDRQTAAEYAENLEENLTSLLDRFKSGTYKAPPVRRGYIPKGDGDKRPIGIPTFEDKVLQRAVVMILEAIYEQDFLHCSYGFRPGRSCHMALEDLWQGVMDMRGGYVYEADIRKFFDTLDHGHLRSFLDLRVRDGVIRRQIDKWLKAGVLEEEQLVCPKTGTPQGGVISPMLANIFLHEVLDKWFEQVVKPRMKGKAFLIRFADDFVMVFREEDDARKVEEVLPKRLGRFGLAVHPEKTRMVRFRPPSGGSEDDGPGERSFDLLGFTHYWGKSRKGNWVVKRKTAKDRFSRGLKRIGQWCRKSFHLDVADQHKALTLKLKGHYQYYGITGNSHRLKAFWLGVRRLWRKWLGRRSQRSDLSWESFVRLEKRYPLPAAIVVRSIFRDVAKP
jgi:RNA-directed DNA polymerase